VGLGELLMKRGEKGEVEMHEEAGGEMSVKSDEMLYESHYLYRMQGDVGFKKKSPAFYFAAVHDEPLY